MLSYCPITPVYRVEYRISCREYSSVTDKSQKLTSRRSTAEVAETIGAFPGIAEANVYGVQIPHHEGRAGCAAIQISPPAAGALDYQQLAQFASQKLPKYAVPVFVRLLSGASHIHNLKQNKAPLRDEGIDLQRVRDQMLWLRGGTYIPFVQEDWEAIQRGDITL